jgi:hypothetical protein
MRADQTISRPNSQHKPGRLTNGAQFTKNTQERVYMTPTRPSLASCAARGEWSVSGKELSGVGPYDWRFFQQDFTHMKFVTDELKSLTPDVVCGVPFRSRRARIRLIAVDAQQTSAHFAGAGRKRVRRRILMAQASRRPKPISALSGTGEGKVFEERAGEESVFGFEILQRPPEKLRTKKLAGTLHIDGGCVRVIGRPGSQNGKSQPRPRTRTHPAKMRNPEHHIHSQPGPP